MRPSTVLSLALLPTFLAVAACSSSATPSSAPSSGQPLTAASAGTSTAVQTSSAGTTSSSAASSPAAAAAKVTVDPCQVVTQAEASALAGHQLTAGKAEDTNGGKRCTYGANTASVFWVQVAQATTAAQAQAEWSQEQAKAQAAINKALPAGLKAALKYQSVGGVGDRAEVASYSVTFSGRTLRLSAIYLLKGPVFLAFGNSALGAVPSADALKAQAQTSLARLP